MKRLFITTIAVVAAIAIAGSCGKKETNLTNLRSSVWLLDEVIYEGSDMTLTPPENVTIIFADTVDRIAGRGGCNNFFGKYDAKEDGNIHIEVGGSTMMACPEMDFETTYFDMLEAVKKYDATAQELRLTIEPEGTILVYKPEFKAYE